MSINSNNEKENKYKVLSEEELTKQLKKQVDRLKQIFDEKKQESNEREER